jgi:hypothetical protein
MTTVVAFAIVAVILLLVVGIILVGASMISFPFLAIGAIIIRYIKGPPV